MTLSSNMRQMEEFFEHLKRAAFHPRTVVDVGVAWGTPGLYDAFPEAYYWLFEPVADFEPALEAILSLPHAPLALSSMQETGVLRAIFPEWAGIECLVIRDFYHRYTVDEHTLVSIQMLADLRQSQDPLERRFAELFEELESPARLLLALLLHDAGKACPNSGHVAESVRLAEQAMERIHSRARRVIPAMC